MQEAEGHYLNDGTMKSWPKALHSRSAKRKTRSMQIPSLGFVLHLLPLQWPGASGANGTCASSHSPEGFLRPGAARDAVKR